MLCSRASQPTPSRRCGLQDHHHPAGRAAGEAAALVSHVRPRGVAWSRLGRPQAQALPPPRPDPTAPARRGPPSSEALVLAQGGIPGLWALQSVRNPRPRPSCLPLPLPPKSQEGRTALRLAPDPGGKQPGRHPPPRAALVPRSWSHPCPCPSSSRFPAVTDPWLAPTPCSFPGHCPRPTSSPLLGHLMAVLPPLTAPGLSPSHMHLQ